MSKGAETQVQIPPDSTGSTLRSVAVVTAADDPASIVTNDNSVKIRRSELQQVVTLADERGNFIAFDAIISALGEIHTALETLIELQTRGG